MGVTLRNKRIKEFLVEYVTGKLDQRRLMALLKDCGRDESEASALILSAPKTIKPRTKPAFKGEELPSFDLVGGQGVGLTK